MTQEQTKQHRQHSVLVLQLIGLVIIIGLAFIIYRDLSTEEAPNIKLSEQPTNKVQTPDHSLPPEKVFNLIYKESIWGTNKEGTGNSGPGSTVDATLIYRTFLQDFLRVNNIRSVVDAGCGDWEFSHTIDWAGIQYKGFDIVEDVIKENTSKYGAPNISFATANMVEEQLPKADLLIVKHVLQHLSNSDVLKFLPQLLKYKHVLLVNSVDTATLSGENKDIPTGGYRDLDVTRSPFNLNANKVLLYRDHLNAHMVLHLFQREPKQPNNK